MCGLFVAVGLAPLVPRPGLDCLAHRGPDATGDELFDGQCQLGHRRLSILDLSPEGRQPMGSADGRYEMVFNGEIYNYLELRAELNGYPFRTGTDSEVLLAAFVRWGADCLHRFVGMFAFAIWDRDTHELFAARDRFGVKPLYLASPAAGELLLASEIKALHAAGVPAVPDETSWASYLVHGRHDEGTETFWRGISRLPAGGWVRWRAGATTSGRWYDLAAAIGPDLDLRSSSSVEEEYVALLEESVRLRFRADVPVGISLSGGLDSSTLLALVHAVQGQDSDVSAFTFVTGDPDYDELPWVREMLAATNHPLVPCGLRPEDVPALAESVAWHQDEPFGGLPTLAYARLFEMARERGVIVLLDGQGMDEQWAGYDYYRTAGSTSTVQGTSGRTWRAECVSPQLARLAIPTAQVSVFTDAIRNTQVRDLTVTKLPRALRFNDRISMRASTELREPFLDHRLVELAVRQPPERKVSATQGKVMLRDIVGSRLPARIVDAPKRPVQTPQREWLRGPLREWSTECIRDGMDAFPEWLQRDAVETDLAAFQRGEGDSAAHVWQWISVGLLARRA